MFGDALAPAEVVLILFSCYLAALTLFMFYRRRKLRGQFRRYPAFAIRDRMVALHLDGVMTAEELEVMIGLCNDALTLSERIEVKHLVRAVRDASDITERAEFGAMVRNLCRQSPAFARQLSALTRFIVIRAIKNSLWQFLAIVALALKAAGRAQVRDTCQRVMGIRRIGEKAEAHAC